MEARTSQRLEMHPTDAEARGIGDGDRGARVERPRIARADGDGERSVPAGVVAARLDWAKMHADGANVNALTSERLTDLGAGATFYSTLVEVGKA